MAIKTVPPQTGPMSIPSEPKAENAQAPVATPKPTEEKDVLEKSTSGTHPIIGGGSAPSSSKLKAPSTTTAPALDVPKLDAGTQLDVKALAARTPKPLERRWDLADPGDAITVLSRFATNQKERMQAEKHTTPSLAFWQDLADNTFAKAHTTTAGMEAALATPGSVSLEESARAMFIYNHDNLELDGLMVTDPGVLQALRIIRVARNPLSPREGILASHAFRNHQPKLCKSDIQQVLEADHEYTRDEFQQMLDSFDMYARNIPDFESKLEQAVTSRQQPDNIKLAAAEGNTWEILSSPVDRALSIIAAKDNPDSLERVEDQELLATLIEQRGGTESITFNRETVAAIANEFIAERDREYTASKKLLEDLADDPNGIAELSRSILLSEENRGGLGRSIGVTDLRFITDEGMRTALRIIAHETDKPDFDIPGTDDDVPNWYFGGGKHEPEYSLECIRGVIEAMKEFDSDQAQGKLDRLAESYNIKIDRKASVKENVETITEGLGVRATHYETVEKSLKKLQEAIAKSDDPEAQAANLIQLKHHIDTEMMPHVHDAEGKAFMKFFSTSLNASIYRNMRGALTDEITKQLSYLEKGGASDSISFNVGVGWGLGPAANVNAGVGVTLAVTGNDDRRIREGKSVNISFGAGGDVGIASLLGKLGFGGKKGKTFKSVDDFVQYHRDDVLLMLLQNGGSKSRFADFKSIKKADKLNLLTKKQMDRFDRTAQLLGVIGPSDGFVVDPNRKPVPSESLALSSNQSVGAALGPKLASLSAKFSAKEGVTLFHKRVDLLDYLESNLDSLQNENVNRPKQTSLPAYPGYEAMADFKARVAKIEDPQKRMETILDAMDGLHAEVTHYTQIVRHYDSLKGPFSWLHKSPMERQMHDIKHSFQEARGVGDRGSFLRAAITTHAHLLNELQKNCTPTQLQSLDLSTMEDTYRFPRIGLKEKHIKKLHQSIRKTGTMAEVAFDVAAAGPLGTGVSATAKVQRIANNSNPDNDGSYLNLSLTGSIDFQKFLPGLIAKLESVPVTELADSAKLYQLVDSALESSSGVANAGVSTAAAFGLNSKIPSSATVELNFIKSHSLALQYARVSAAGGPSVSVDNIPVGGGATVSLGASRGWTRRLFEKVGSGTLTYVQTQFNGFKLAGGDWEKAWGEWSSENEKDIWKLATNMGTADTNANKEMRDLAADLKGEAYQTYTRLEATLDSIRNSDGFDKGLHQQFTQKLAQFLVAAKGSGTLARARMLEAGWKPTAS